MPNTFNRFDPFCRTLPEGVRGALPVILPTAVLGASYGVVASPVLGATATVAMSAIVWSGTAQLAALSVLAPGGPWPAAVASGLVANIRFLPMGLAVAPSLTGQWWRRAAIGATIADASYSLASRPGGRVDVTTLVWAGLPQWLAWVGGTALGTWGGTLLDDPRRWGLDVVFPVLYLGLLAPELRGRRWIAVAAGLVAAALVPIAPLGVPVLGGALVALLGLRGGGATR